MAKNALEKILSGVVAMDGGTAIWCPAFEREHIYALLRLIQTKDMVLIELDRKKSQVRLFGSPECCDSAQRKLSCYVKSTREQEPAPTHDTKSVQELDPKYSFYIKDNKQANMLAAPRLLETLSAVGLDVVDFDTALMEVIGTDSQHRTAKEIFNADFPGVYTIESQKYCVICHTTADDPILATCGHIYCSKCFENQCKATGSGNAEFSIKCHGDHGQCDKTFTLGELQKHLSPIVFEETLHSSFMSYIRRRPNLFHFCPTPDCNQIYQIKPETNANTDTDTRTEDKIEEKAEIEKEFHHCPKCIQEICTSCHASHPAQSCTDYKNNLSDVDQELERLKKRKRFKNCPKCGILIDKYMGCQHVVCSSCQIHFCWRCLRYFGTRKECFDHIMREGHMN